MKKGLGRQIDKTSIKEVGLKSIKPCRDIQGTDFAGEDINVVANSIYGISEEFNIQH